MVEWSEDHGAAIGFLNSNLGLVGITWLNWRPGGALGKKCRPSVGKVGEWFMESRHLQGCSLRLCRLRTNGLAPASKYWMYRSHAGVYGPIKPSGRLLTEAWLFPTVSLAVVGERLGTDSWIGQPTCCGMCRELFFMGAVDLFKSVDDCVKGCYMWTTWDMYGRGSYADRAWKACGVLVGFSPVGCTLIQITAALRYEYRLFVAVIT
jgi:hypothetical protein